jgi:hypothetical protein
MRVTYLPAFGPKAIFPAIDEDVAWAIASWSANEGGKRFYEREGWQMRSVVYKKMLF